MVVIIGQFLGRVGFDHLDGGCVVEALPTLGHFKVQLRSCRMLELTYRNLLVAKSDEQPEHSVTMMLPVSVCAQEEKDWVAPLSVEEEPGPGILSPAQDRIVPLSIEEEPVPCSFNVGPASQKAAVALDSIAVLATAAVEF